ncbi:MAG: hypothetical protein HC875_16350 [Anaerolineales bacterium]|nr:hypothetical protein [Anaerolineales bacterium]
MLPEMIGIGGVIGWAMTATAVTAVFVVKENGGKFSQKLSDQAIFVAIIGICYSLAHGLVGAILGGIIGILTSVMFDGGSSLAATVLSGAIIGSYFGPIFVAGMLLRYYAAAEPKMLAENEPVASSPEFDPNLRGESGLHREASRAKSWRIAEI